MTDYRAMLPRLTSPLIFGAITLAMFATVLFADANTVVGSPFGDLIPQFLGWRKFGFDELARGHLALWNPHVYGGTPYFGFFQAALLYPPNWIFMVLPLNRAVNVSIALHVFLAGQFMYIWARSRGLTRAAGILGGVMFMFSGPYFPHIYAGHLPHLCLIVWTPLLFYGLDCFAHRWSWRGFFVGSGALSMILLAGHPQYVYFLAIPTVIYVALNVLAALWFRYRAASDSLATRPLPTAADGATNPKTLLAGAFAIAIAAALLCAVQLLAGLDATAESVRSGVKYDFARQFSLPPENLLTLLAPGLLGSMPIPTSGVTPPANAVSYFGRAYLWEMQLFMTATGLLFAIFGAFVGERSKRFATTMVVVSLLLALGAHTPLHRLMFDHFPGFAGFRGASKFTFVAATFFPLLAAIGFDWVQRRGRPPLTLAVAAASAAGLAALFAIAVWISGGSGVGGSWHQFLRFAAESAANFDELYYDARKLLDPTFIATTAGVASTALWIAALTLAAVAAVLFVARRKPVVVYAIVALATIEGFFFAYSTRVTTSVPDNFPAAWRGAVALNRPNRVLTPGGEFTNAGLLENYEGIWGYDPGVLRRYAELIAASQGVPPAGRDTVDQYVQIGRINTNVFRLLRASLILLPDERRSIVPVPNVMPVVSIFANAIVMEDDDRKRRRDRIVDTLVDPATTPDAFVLLETKPPIAPVSGAVGKASAKSIDSDTLDIDATVDKPAILLVTNNYSTGWRADAIGNSSQRAYTIQPANWTQIGIPLAAGEHHLRLSYRPANYVLGRWISLTAAVAYLGGGAFLLYRRRTCSRPSAS